MLAKNKQSHSYEIGEVLLRGVPMVHSRKESRFKQQPSELVDLFLHQYYAWLGSSTDHAEVAVAYEKLFGAAEDVFTDPNSLMKLDHMNAPNLMAGLIGGDIELGLMELFQSWEEPRQQRSVLQNYASERYLRECRRIEAIMKQLTDLSGDELFTPSNGRKTTIGRHSNDTTSEGVRLSMQFAAHAVLGELLEHKTRPPHRGIKNVGDKIGTLAVSAGIANEILLGTVDREAIINLKGALLEAETMILLWRACVIGELKNAWPIVASQRLDYGRFRKQDDGPNTDLLCIFPDEDLAIPVQVHAADEYVTGEGTRAAVIHKKDIYTHSSYNDIGLSTGIIILGSLGVKPGASQDYIDTRATFLASKINNVAKRIRTQ